MQPALVCLHGWGGSKESFTELRAALEGAPVRIYTPDLPGFGAEPEPKQPWGVPEYAQWVKNYLHREHIQEPILLLGHSFGGQLAAALAIDGSVQISHLYLCAAAIVRSRMGTKRTIGYALAKTGKAVLSIPGLRVLQPILKKVLYKLMRVHDYEQASPIMQKILVTVTHQPLTEQLSSIAVPTDIFWGEEDRQTPLYEGKMIQERIAGSVLHSFPNVRHSVHRAHAKDIAACIRASLPSA